MPVRVKAWICTGTYLFRGRTRCPERWLLIQGGLLIQVLDSGDKVSYSINYNDNENGIIIVWSGEVDGSDLIQSAYERFSDNERVKKLKYIISDYTNVTKLDATHNAIYNLCQIFKYFSKQNNNIYLAGIHPTDYMRGISNMRETYANDDNTGWHIKSFRTREEGEKWLLKNLDNTLSFDKK